MRWVQTLGWGGVLCGLWFNDWVGQEGGLTDCGDKCGV